jgi:hypothetical protein
MANFPALNPQSRTYTPGAAPSTPLGALDGDELMVRHANVVNGYTLRLGFTGLTQAQHFEITSHYMLHGRFEPFDLDAITLLGSGLTFPSGYSWIYVKAPDTTYTPDVISVSVELELVAPYTL